MGWNAIVEYGVWGFCEDDDREEEDGDRRGELLCGGEEGGDGDVLNDFKGVLITNFWTWEWIPSSVSKSWFEYIAKVPSGCLEIEDLGFLEVEWNE